MELSLVDLGLSLDKISLSFCLSISDSKTSGAHTLILSLEFPEILIYLLVLYLRVNFKTLKHAIRLLLKAHRLVLGCSLLGAGLDLESHVD